MPKHREEAAAKPIEPPRPRISELEQALEPGFSREVLARLDRICQSNPTRHDH